MLLSHYRRRLLTGGASLPNGSAPTLHQRRFLINHDGSQDEGAKDNDRVLKEFLSPFLGVSPHDWKPSETRLTSCVLEGSDAA